MKLRYAMLPLLAIGLGLAIRREPGRRETRWEAIEDPEAARAYASFSDSPHFRLIRWLAARRTATEVAGRALDIGSGPGKLALQLARRSPALAVVGMDLSPEMVEVASENAREAGLGDRVTFREGSVEAIPFPEASFDLVVSTLSLHHWSDAVAGLREVARVTRPFGRYFVLDLRRDIAILPWLGMGLAQKVILPPALRAVGEPRGSVLSAYTPGEAAQLAQEAGLRDWRVTSGPFWLTIESAE